MSDADAAPCGCARARRTPPLPVDDTQLRVVAIDVHQGWSEIFCRCSGCGRRWRVERDTSYHYPTYQWNDVSQDATLAARFDSGAVVESAAAVFPAPLSTAAPTATSQAGRNAARGADLAALAERLCGRPVGSGCAACRGAEAAGDFAGTTLPAAVEAALPTLGTVAHGILHQCAGCGALYWQSWYGPAAADDLLGLETRTQLRRTTLDDALRVIAAERRSGDG